MKNRKCAHFLLLSELLYSPPNNAIINAYVDNGYSVDVFSPGKLPQATSYGRSVQTHHVEYTWLWLFKNLFSRYWLKYEIISGTSEDPLAFVAVLGLLYGRKTISLVDEIKAGSYRGDRSELWKGLCRVGIKRSRVRIVNDESRVELLKEYANITDDNKIIVYPGCFIQRPERNMMTRDKYRSDWGFGSNSFVIGSSGGFNMTAGADWLLSSIRDNQEISAVIQPLGVSDLSMYLLRNLGYANRVYIQAKRMDWLEAWESAQGFDLGLCIYTNQSPQFQKMGISSNRLCMYIAMGVPVIASKQKSFDFLETYGCGILVNSYGEFLNAIRYIHENRYSMSVKCEECFMEYIRPEERYGFLSDSIRKIKNRR